MKKAYPVLSAFLLLLSCSKKETESPKVYTLDPQCSKVIKLPGLTLPTAFTPNGDGKNDLYRPVVTQAAIENFDLTVRRLNGEIVFQTNLITKGWDGSDKNGVAATDYLYQVSLKCKDAEGQLRDTCSYLYLLQGQNCINHVDGDVPKYWFEDQIDLGTGEFMYVTAENFCP